MGLWKTHTADLHTEISVFDYHSYKTILAVKIVQHSGYSSNTKKLQISCRFTHKFIDFFQEIFKKPEVDSSQQGYMQRYVWGWGSWYYGTGTSTEEESMGEETDVDAVSSSRLSKSPPKIGEWYFQIGVHQNLLKWNMEKNHHNLV